MGMDKCERYHEWTTLGGPSLYNNRNRLALLLLRTANAIYLLTLPPEVPPIPSTSCVLILVIVLSPSTSAANWFLYSSCLL